MIDQKVKNIVFVSEGGLGKVIASTAIVRRLKEEYPEKRIIVVAGYPEVFQFNPNVHRVFNFNNPLNFYDDWITPESHVIKLEPYAESDYIFNRKSLIETWCNQCGVEYKDAKPELFFMDNEKEAGRLYVKKITANNTKKFVLFQWCGGIIPNDREPMSFHETKMRMHRRTLPTQIAQEVVNRLIAKKYVVGTCQHENYPPMEGAERIFYAIRGVLVLLHFAEGFIGIDSFLHHGAEAVGAKGVVIWGGTNPNKLGYKDQCNMTREVCPTPFCHRPDSYVFDGNPSTGLWNCPHNEACLNYKAEDIVAKFEEAVRVESEEKVAI